MTSSMKTPMPKAMRATKEPRASTSSPEIHHERVVTVDLIADRGRLRKGGGSAEGRPQVGGGSWAGRPQGRGGGVVGGPQGGGWVSWARGCARP